MLDFRKLQILPITRIITLQKVHIPNNPHSVGKLQNDAYLVIYYIMEICQSNDFRKSKGPTSGRTLSKRILALMPLPPMNLSM